MGLAMEEVWRRSECRQNTLHNNSQENNKKKITTGAACLRDKEAQCENVIVASTVVHTFNPSSCETETG